MYPPGYCGGPTTAEKEWNAQTDAYNKTVRLLLVAGGVLAALVALVVLPSRTLAASLVLAAILALYRSTGYEVPVATLHDQTHVILLGLAWIILVYLGRTLFPRL